MRRMILIPPFDNNSYVWQGKGWKKINIYSDTNLAIPDLQGKEYLGDGIYRLYNNNGITTDYNVINGIFTINGVWLGSSGQGPNISYINVNGLTLTVSVEIISGILPTGTVYRPVINDTIYQISTFQGISYEVTYTSNSDYIRMTNGVEYNNFQYRVQLEQGSTATPYTPPAAPVRYYLQHNYEPQTIEGFVNFEGKILSDFSQLKEIK